MKHYIEAFRDDMQLIATGSGQNVLSDYRAPLRSTAWRAILARKIPDAWKGANRWRMVDERGKVLAEHRVSFTVDGEEGWR